MSRDETAVFGMEDKNNNGKIMTNPKKFKRIQSINGIVIQFGTRKMNP